MPRLGQDSAPEGSPTSRQTASAYPDNGFNIRRFIFILAFTLILRNIFFTDYRTEEIGYLRGQGKSDEEIEKYIPKTSQERYASNKQKLSEYEQLKVDVKVLKDKVESLENIASSLSSRSNHVEETSEADAQLTDSTLDTKHVIADNKEAFVDNKEVKEKVSV